MDTVLFIEITEIHFQGGRYCLLVLIKNLRDTEEEDEGEKLGRSCGETETVPTGVVTENYFDMMPLC